MNKLISDANDLPTMDMNAESESEDFSDLTPDSARTLCLVFLINANSSTVSLITLLNINIKPNEKIQK